MCNDLREAVTQDTDQGCDQQNVRHADKYKLDTVSMGLTTRREKLPSKVDQAVD